MTVLLMGACLATVGIGRGQAGDQEKGEQYVRMARVAEADQDWLRSLALYNLAAKTGASLDGLGARRQYVIDMATEAKLNPSDAEKIPDPTIRKSSAKEEKTGDLVTEAQKAERAGNYKLAMEKYNEAASLNPLNFYLIGQAKKNADKAGVKLPPLPPPSMPDEPHPVTEIPAGPAPTATPPADPPTGTSQPITADPKTPTATTPVPTVATPAPVVPVAPAVKVPTEAELAEKMTKMLVNNRVHQAFLEKIDKREKELGLIETEFTAITDEPDRNKMLGLLRRDIFTEAVGRLSGLKRPANYSIETKIDAKNTYFYTPGGETYKLTLTMANKPTSAFITFRVGVVPGSTPACSTQKLESPEGKKILDAEKAELEEWRKNQNLKENIMQGPGSFNENKAQVFTLDNRALQAVVNSYVVEEGGVLMVYRTYSKRNPQLDRELKKIIGFAQGGF